MRICLNYFSGPLWRASRSDETLKRRFWGLSRTIMRSSFLIVFLFCPRPLRSCTLSVFLCFCRSFPIAACVTPRFIAIARLLNLRKDFSPLIFGHPRCGKDAENAVECWAEPEQWMNEWEKLINKIEFNLKLKTCHVTFGALVPDWLLPDRLSDKHHNMTHHSKIHQIFMVDT